MTPTSLALGSPQWLVPTVALMVVGAAAVVWSYARWRGPRWVALSSAVLKLVGIAALALSLVEPMLTGSRPSPGANIFVVLVDTSQSLKVRDGDSDRTRADWAKKQLEGNPRWRARLGQDFDTRNFVFDTHLRGVDGFEGLAFDGTATSLHAALGAVAKRYQGRPLAGVLLVSDGNATDDDTVDWSALPPVYPVLPPTARGPKDVAVRRVTLNQTNFEAAPVALTAEVSASGFRDEPVVAVVTDEAGKEVARQEATPTAEDEVLPFRFQFKPERAGVAFYRVRPDQGRTQDPADKSDEQTLANNGRLVGRSRRRTVPRPLRLRPAELGVQIPAGPSTRTPRCNWWGWCGGARRPKFDFRDAHKSPPNNRCSRTRPPRGGRPSGATSRSSFASTPRTRSNPGGFRRPPPTCTATTPSSLMTWKLRSSRPDQHLLLRNFVAAAARFLMLGGPDSFAAGRVSHPDPATCCRFTWTARRTRPAAITA